MDDHIMDLLDDTRIHPESYQLAKTLAKDVYLEDMVRDANEMDDDEQEMVIEHVRANPCMLKALDIDEYVKSIPHGPSKRETLHDIKMEILHGFKDWRAPFRDPTPDEEFLMLSGEPNETLSEGRIVQVTVRAIQEKRIVCTFDSGLEAFISLNDFSDGWFNRETLQVHKGDVLTGKIKNVDRGRFRVYLTCKESDMRRVYADRSKLDPYYHEMDLGSNNEVDKGKKRKELARKCFKPRMIVHPRFRNMTYDEAIEYLANKDPGESIIRPSSKGPSFLALTLKIYDGVYKHKEIVESGKDCKNITDLLRLGKMLTIDGDSFEDLDEVMDRYVDPLVGYLKQMLSYRKFKKGTKEQVDEQVRADRAKYPAVAAYGFGVSHEHPGTFILTCIPNENQYSRNENLYHDYLDLFPKGFRFRKKDFADDTEGLAVDKLSNFFKYRITKKKNKSPAAAGMPLRNVAAMVPRKFDGGRGGRRDSRDGGRGRGRDGDYGNNNNDVRGSNLWSSRWGSKSTDNEGGGGLENLHSPKVLA